MDIVTVANRLPVRMGEDGWELSPGGLVTALRPVMATHSGAWVGWDGGTRGIPATMPDLSVRLMPIALSASQLRQYYHGAANATLWPLDRKSTRLNSSHPSLSYAVFCLKKKTNSILRLVHIKKKTKSVKAT